jgi:ACS family allantoate permease-like MFS transporter
MADMEKVHDASSDDPEKVTELGRKTTFGDGELDEVVFKHANPQDADEALKAFAGLEGDSLEMTPEEEKKLLRKIDLNLMPVSLELFTCIETF